MRFNNNLLKKKIYLLPVVWLAVFTILFILYPWYKADQEFTKRKYNFSIKEIEFREGHRGHPHIKLDTGWYLLNIEEMKIKSYIMVGDSVVKSDGVKKIIVYRKDEDGNWEAKVFD